MADEDDEPGKRREWIDDEGSEDDGDYIEVPKDAGWRDQGDGPRPTWELTADEIRERFDDAETAEQIIESLRNSPGTRVYEELGPTEDDENEEI